MCSESPGNINNHSNARLFSELMKFTAVNDGLSKQSRMFCSREKLIGLIVKQQNDKSSQVYSRKLLIRGLAITVTIGKVCY